MFKYKELPSTWAQHDYRVRTYVWSHRLLSVSRLVIGLLFIVFLFVTNITGSLEWKVATATQNGFLRWLVYLGILSACWEIISFPFSMGHFMIEKQYGLSKQKMGNWFWDKAKGWLLGVVLGTIVLGLLYLAVGGFGRYWWLAAAAFLVFFSIVLAQLAPVILIPIFFKLKPMDPSPLKERLLQLCGRFGVEVKDVYHLGLGEKTEKGNAAFVGIGKTKRILIGDTLYQKFAPEEVEAVFAHELGHQVHNDLWKGIFFSSIWIVLSFWLADGIVLNFWANGISGWTWRPQGLLIFFIVLSVIQIPIGVVQVAFSRYRENKADDFAAEKIGSGGTLAQALEKLTFQNYGFFRPHPILEFLQHSHPAPWRRITKLRTS